MHVRAVRQTAFLRAIEIEMDGHAWLLTPGARDRLIYRCANPTWSVDAAAWLAEVFTEAFQDNAEKEPVAISVAALR
jgi:hypothetical protein